MSCSASGFSRSLRPSCDDAVQRVEAVRERGGAGLQDDRRLHFVQLAVAHRWNVRPTGPRRDLFGPEFLPAPRADDDVRRGADDLGGVGHDAVLSQGGGGAPRKDVAAARDADELAHPADGADLRIIPFLEIDAWMARERCATRANLVDVRL